MILLVQLTVMLTADEVKLDREMVRKIQTEDLGMQKSVAKTILSVCLTTRNNSI